MRKKRFEEYVYIARAYMNAINLIIKALATLEPAKGSNLSHKLLAMEMLIMVR
jgi:hypothetical protein